MGGTDRAGKEKLAINNHRMYGQHNNITMYIINVSHEIIYCGGTCTMNRHINIFAGEHVHAINVFYDVRMWQYSKWKTCV